MVTLLMERMACWLTPLPQGQESGATPTLMMMSSGLWERAKVKCNIFPDKIQILVQNCNHLEAEWRKIVRGFYFLGLKLFCKKKKRKKMHSE